MSNSDDSVFCSALKRLLRQRQDWIDRRSLLHRKRLELQQPQQLYLIETELKSIAQQLVVFEERKQDLFRQQIRSIAETTEFQILSLSPGPTRISSLSPQQLDTINPDCTDWVQNLECFKNHIDTMALASPYDRSTWMQSIHELRFIHNQLHHCTMPRFHVSSSAQDLEPSKSDAPTDSISISSPQIPFESTIDTQESNELKIPTKDNKEQKLTLNADETFPANVIPQPGIPDMADRLKQVNMEWNGKLILILFQLRSKLKVTNKSLQDSIDRDRHAMATFAQ
jgi:hypothetical protein